MERVEEVRRWFLQALRDFKASNDSIIGENYVWACFQAQQAAEKAVKALLYVHGKVVWGYSIVEFLNVLKELERVDEELCVAARELDRHYIPPRYPNAFESGYPGMYYDKSTAERAYEAARRIVEWVRVCLRNHK